MSEPVLHTAIRRFSEGWDPEAATVISDWCEEHYLAKFAKTLRDGIARKEGPEQPWLIFHDLENLADLIGVAEIVRAPGSFTEWLNRKEQPRSMVEVMGFPPAVVQPFASAWVTQSPVMYMRILELKIDDTIADAFNVDQITINGRETRVTGEPLSARNFNLHNPIHFPIVPPGGAIQIQVTNHSNTVAEFRASARIRSMY